MKLRKPRALTDTFLSTLGVVFGLGSLAYPFGRDQGLYYYVAREWVLRGAIPYRDVLDHKTPGIYLLHALSVLLFGEQMWGIRLFDLLCVVAVGLVAGSLSASPAERVRPGVRGAAVLATSVLYFGYLDFWNSAQSELWYAMLAIASVAAAVRMKSDARAAFVAGVLGGCAVLMKPPAVWLVLVAFLWLTRRSFRKSADGGRVERAKSALYLALLFGAGTASVPTLVLSYFGAKGALPAMFDIVVGANSFYVKHERGGPALDGIRDYHWFYFPLVPALLLYLVCALVRTRARDRDSFERHLVAVAVTGAAYAAVIMQGKYYLLHWSVMIPAFAVIVANAARALGDAVEARGGRLAFAASFMALLGGLFALSVHAGELGPQRWWTSTQHAWRWSWGDEPREAFTWHFQSPDAEFWFWTSDKVGRWLGEHTTPEDLVTVRGFQPEIYAVARRHHGGRFFWTTFLTNPDRAYNREAWLREDREALIAHPSKYVVALTYIPQGPDSVRFFEQLGYRTATVIHEFTIMERVPVEPTP